MLFMYYIVMAAISLFSIIQFQEIPDDGHGYTIGSGYSPHTFFRRITHIARRHTIVRRRSAPGPVLVLPIFLPTYPVHVPFHLGNGTGDYVQHTWFSPPHSIAAPHNTQLADDLLPEGVMPSNLSLSKTDSPLRSDFANLSTSIDDAPIIWGPMNAPWAIEPITSFIRDTPVSPPAFTAPHTPSHADQTTPLPDDASGLDCPDCPEGWTLVETVTVHHRIFRLTKDLDSHAVTIPSIRYEDAYIDDSPFKKATQLWFSNNYNSVTHFLASEAVVTLCLKFAVLVAILCVIVVLVSEAGHSSLVKRLDGKTKSNLDPFDLIFRRDDSLLASEALQTDPTLDAAHILSEKSGQVEKPAAASTWSLFPTSPASSQYPPLPSSFPQDQDEPLEKPLMEPIVGAIDSDKLSSTQSKSDRIRRPVPRRALNNQSQDDSQNEEPLEKAREESVVRASTFDFNFNFPNPVRIVQATESPSNSKDTSVGTETKVNATDTVLQNGSSADAPESTPSAAGTGAVPTEEGQRLHEEESIMLPSPSSTKVTDSAGHGNPDADSADSASVVTSTQASEVADGPSPTADPNDAQTWTTVSDKNKNKKNKGKNKGKNKAQKPPAQAELAPQ